MKGWLRYKQFIEKNMRHNAPSGGSKLAYWKNNLFINIVIYSLPVSLIALVPGVIMSVKEGIPLLAIYDCATAIAIMIIGFTRGISLAIRKTIFITCLYMLAFILLVYLGTFGPGLMYMLGLSVFMTLIFQHKIAYTSIFINAFVCFVFAFFIQYKIIDPPLAQAYDAGAWIAVSSNLVFLSTVVVLAITVLFKGFEKALKKEENLQDELRKKTERLEEMLDSMKAKNQELEQFAYIASHDLQEPLKTISGFTELLKERYEPVLDANGNLFVEYISKSTSRMRALITGLLEYSRIGKEQEPELVQCNVLVKNIIDDLYDLIQATQASIRVAELPELPAYSLELKQLFQNLLSNAIKFRKADVPVVINIRAEKEGKHWLFSVEDNGIGIDKKFSEKIFVIFQRLHPRSQYEGAGIGLAHCKKIIELHGGKIWLTSEPGQGSTFYFTIPHKK